MTQDIISHENETSTATTHGYGSVEDTDVEEVGSAENFNYTARCSKFPIENTAHEMALAYDKQYVQRLMASIFLSIFVMIVLIAVFTTDSTSNSQNITIKDDQSVGISFDDDDSIWKFSFRRVGYDILPVLLKKNVFIYKFLEPYKGVIEPYVSMELYIDDNEINANDFSYKFSITNQTDSVVGYGSYVPANNASDSFSIECKPYETFQVTVAKYSNGIKRSTMKGEVICLYVRREFRELRPEDLTTAFDAMYSMWQYEEDEGQQLFGESFHNSYYFSETHNFNAAWRDSDHIHEGLGFIPQHLKMTNIFEASMQAFDPSVSLFFWDFTYETVNEINIFESPYFQAGTFGKLYPAHNDTLGWTYTYDDISKSRILNGRWKDLHAEANQKYPDLENGYGYMRGPWNMNPSKYITRFATTYAGLPGCGNYKEWLLESDFEAFMKMAPYAPHSTTHTSIGGVYGCDIFDNMTLAGLIIDTDAQLELCQKWGFYVKEMYRGNYLTPRKNCSTITQDCGFDCNEENLDDMLYMMRETISLNNYVPDNITNDDWQLWRDFVCNGDAYKIFVGDHLESASPSDPSFWPIHPTQERLLQAKYMTGGFHDYTWPVTAEGDSYVCNHAECYESEDGVKDYYEECCYGHYEYDQLLDFVHGNRTHGFGPTNAETLAATDAGSLNYSMPYIYSNFDWDHCGDEIVAIGAKLWTENREMEIT